MTRVITYGTFDLFHIGHVRLLNRLSGLGSNLTVGVSTDEFNERKGKKTVIPFDHRAEIVSSIKGVDNVIAEENWDQKRRDIATHGIDIFAMGEDWRGRFDDLSDVCQVVYLERTDGISSTKLKKDLGTLSTPDLESIQDALTLLKQVIDNYNSLR